MTDKRVNSKRIVKNTLFLYLRMVVIMLITLYTTRELMSALGVEDYGLYNVVCGFVTMFGFLNTSMANGTQRFYNYYYGKGGEDTMPKVYSHALIIQLMMAVVILVIVESFGVWYLEHKMNIPSGRDFAAFWIFQFAMVQLLLVMMTVPYSAAILAYERMNTYAFIGIIDASLKLLIVYSLRRAPFDRLVFYGALMTIVSLIFFLLNFIYCKSRILSLKYCKIWDRTLFSKMLFFSGWNVFGSLSHMMQNQGVNLVLNAFWGATMNAANGVAHQINGAVTSLTNGFISAVRPQMIKSYAKGDMDYLKKMYYSASKLTFFLVVILAVPLIGEMNTILDLWLGSGKYPEITPIISQLTILMAICNSYATPTSIVIHATGEMKRFQLLVSFVTLMIIPISYIAAKMGCKAPLIILLNAFITVIAQITRLIIMKDQVGFPIVEYVYKVFFPTWAVLIISLGFSYLMHSISPSTVLWTVTRIMLTVVVSCIAILFIGTNVQEKRLVLSIVSKRTNRVV